MKMKRPHIVPLSMQVRAMLEELRGDSAYVFVSPANIDKPISNNAMLYAMYRAGYHSKMTLRGPASAPASLRSATKNARRNRMPSDLR